MHLIHHKTIAFFQFRLLADLPGIWHGIFPRFAFDDSRDRIPFNLGLHGLDSEELVWRNRRRAIDAAGLSFAVFARQVHGVDVSIWKSDQVYRHEIGSDHARLTGDALVTDTPDVALFIQTADCQSVVIVDPVKRVVANVHSGWRGSIGNIVGQTVDAMHECFNCDPRDLHCGIGPSIGPCCAEFIHYRQEIPESYWGYRHSGNLFDFWRMTIDQLTQKGVLRNHIESGDICTRCNQHLFYSYRGEREWAGRFAAVVGLTS